VAGLQGAAERVNSVSGRLQVTGGDDPADEDAQHGDLGINALELGSEGE
jgi:hypothetical protein